MKPKISRLRDPQPGWLHPGLLASCFVAFLFLFAIAGSYRTRGAELSGNPYWEDFAAFERAETAGVTTIGIWRHDRMSFEETGAQHCGLIVRAVRPGTTTEAAEEAMRLAWAESGLQSASENGGSGGTVIEEARLEDAFCGRAERLRLALGPDIRKAWRDEANPRFLKRTEDRRALFAGVFDREGRRVYTWLTVRPPLPPPPL